MWDRAEWACERCGKSLDRRSEFSIHHRHPRGMGGTKASWINDLSNLMLLCGSGTTGCHGWIEAHRAEAYANGWLIRGGKEMPWEVPVVVHSGHRLVTDEDPIVVLPRGGDE